MKSILDAILSTPSFGTIQRLSPEGSVDVELSTGKAQHLVLDSSSSTIRFGWEGAAICILDTEEPMVILEPDYLVDVTTVAECIAGGTALSPLALLKKFEPRSLNGAAAKGNLVNSVVDIVIANPSVRDEDAIAQALAERPLTWASLHQIGEDVDAMVAYARDLLPTIRTRVQSWQDANVTVEPHVLSPVLGLQGRFDIIVDRNGVTDLIELKAGKAPKAIRANHAAQVAAYQMLFTAASGVVPRSASIWYAAVDAIRDISKTHIHGMLATDTAETLHQLIIETRNEIVSQDHALCIRNFSGLRKLRGTTLAGAGPAGAFESDLVEAYRSSTSLLRTVFQVWTSFLAVETKSLKMNSTGRSQSDLWKLTAREKEHSQTVITNLVANGEKSDSVSRHVTFDSEEPLVNIALRTGDLVLLHHSLPSTSKGWNVVKGWVTKIGECEIEVSFRNKQFDWQDIIGHRWTVEQDTSDLGLRTLTSGLFELLAAEPMRREIIVGKQPPRFSEAQIERDDELSDEQNQVLESALQAQDYFLLQGPPGTGKTSKMLRSIVRRLQKDPNERVLVVAYTNRAVDEICSVLLKALPKNSFLRHGSKVGTAAFSEISTTSLGDGKTAAEAAHQLAGTRVIVTTIQSANNGQELFAFGNFTTLVVDEASQILEPHLLGLMARIPRSILIGDHAQLPPIISQSDEYLNVRAKILIETGLVRTSASLFERLFLQCEKQGWNDAFATLSLQGRMHADISSIVSNIFYNGQLRTALPWQNQMLPTPWSDVLPARATFINVSTHGTCEQRQAELHTVLQVIKDLLPYLSNPKSSLTIGVITPFRAQNRAITAELVSMTDINITVDTVERFQGSQRDIIIFSTSVASESELKSIQSVAILNESTVDRKLNVACSRARNQFVLIGDSSILSKSEEYRQVIDAIRI